MPTVLITGANRGLGLELARQYAADGWRVMACTRQPDAAALDALEQEHRHVSLHALEVTDAASIETLATALRGTTQSTCCSTWRA